MKRALNYTLLQFTKSKSRFTSKLEKKCLQRTLHQKTFNKKLCTNYRSRFLGQINVPWAKYKRKIFTNLLAQFPFWSAKMKSVFTTLIPLWPITFQKPEGVSNVTNHRAESSFSLPSRLKSKSDFWDFDAQKFS